jgi:hypothetical protein
MRAISIGGCLLFASVAQPAALFAQQPPTTTNDVSAEILAALEGQADCKTLNRLWKTVKDDPGPAGPAGAIYRSRKTRLADRRKELGCVRPGPGKGSKVVEKTDPWTAYQDLLETVKVRRKACGTDKTCPGLTEAETELVRITLVNTRVLPPSDKRREDLEKNLGTVFGGLAPFEAVLRRLGQSPLTPREADDVLDLAFDVVSKQGQGRDVATLRRMMDGMKAVPTSDVERVVDAAVDLYQHSGGDPDWLARKLKLAPLFTNKIGREAMAEALRRLEARHPYLKNEKNFAGAQKEIQREVPDEQLLQGFFRRLDRALFDEVDYDTGQLTNGTPPPRRLEDRPIALFIAPHDVQFATQLTTTFVNRLKGKARDGVRLAVAASLEDEPRIEDIATRILTKLGEENHLKNINLCQSKTSEPIERELCTFPYGAVVLLSLTDLHDDGFVPVARCWAPLPGGKLDASRSTVARVATTDGGAQEDAGTTLAADVLDSCARYVRHEADPPPPPPPPPTPRPSRWTALALSGLPYLQAQDRDRSTLGWVLSGIDVGLLVAGVGTGAAAIDARNAYSNGQTDALGRANTWLAVSAACLGAVLVERLLAAVFYR